MSLADFTHDREACKRAPLRDSERVLFWPDLDMESRRSLPFFLREFRRGGCVGVWGTNSLDYLTLMVRLLRAGCIPVPLNIRSTPDELAMTAWAVRMEALIAIRHFTPAHRAAIQELPVWQLTPEPMRVVALREGVNHLFALESASLLICSSGSEGSVKAVQLAVRGMFSHAAAVCKHLLIGPADSWLICLPFFHVGGLAIPFRCLVAGASFLIVPEPDPAELNARIDRGDVTVVSVVPTLLQAMLAERDDRPFPPSLRAVVVGGGPVSDDLLERCPQALPSYGLTEAGSMLTCARPGCDDFERHSAGRCLPGAEIKIVSENGVEVPKGAEGLILARGPGLARGYWKNPILSARVFHEGWLHTGDVGRLDEQGNLYVLARRTDVVLSGGENIYPAEIERVILQHPQITAAIVLPIPDEKWGQVPAALVVPKDGVINENELLSFLEKQLARYKLPRRIVFSRELPLLANGKPDLNAVRKLLI